MSTEAIYYVRFEQSGTQVGPIDAVQLRGLAREGKIAPGDFIRRMPSQSWTKAANVKGLLPATNDPGSAFMVGPWYVQAGGRKGGPYSIDKIRILVQRQVLTPEALASVDGKDWKPARHIPGAFDVPAGRAAADARGSVPAVEDDIPTKSTTAPVADATMVPPRAAPGFVRNAILRSPRAFRVLVVLSLVVFLVAVLVGSLVSTRKLLGESDDHTRLMPEAAGGVQFDHGGGDLDGDDPDRGDAGEVLVVVDDDASNIDRLIEFPDPTYAIGGTVINSNDKGGLKLDKSNFIIAGEQKFPRNSSAAVSTDLRVRGFQVSPEQRILRLDARAVRGGVRIFPDLNQWIRTAGPEAQDARVAVVDESGAKYFAVGLVEDDGQWVFVKSMGGKPLRLRDIPIQPLGSGKKLYLHFRVPGGANIRSLVLAASSGDRVVNTINLTVPSLG